MANNHKTLASLFSDTADAIREKQGSFGSKVADNFPAEIRKIVSMADGTNDATAVAADIVKDKTAYVKGKKVIGTFVPSPATAEAVLESLTVTPTGETFTVTPDDGVDGFDSVKVKGDYNLTPENIAEGITIYGVEGTLKIGASEEVPNEYESFIEHAKQLYTGDYANLAILESNNILNVAFLMDDFKVLSYNESTTEFTAIGWLYCEYTKATQTWRVVNYTTEASTGQNYVKHIRYSSMYWEYNGQVIWPFGMSGGGGGAGLNIAYGDTAPEDTTKLWVKAAEPNVVKVTNGLSVDANSIERLGELNASGAFFASASVGKKVYMFGGEYSTSASALSDKIYAYDSENNTIKALDAVLPAPVNGHACAAVGTKVYIFGGWDGRAISNRIDIFDTETETIQTCGTTMPTALESISVAPVGKKIYIFGGNQRNVYAFDTETETFKTCSAVMPQTFFDAAAASVGSKIYIFGGYGNNYLNTIYEYDTLADKVKTMGTTLPIKAHDMAAAAWGTKVYIFGGNCGNYDSDDIIVFDAATGAVETLETSLPNACSGISAATIGATVYLFGGRPRSGYFADMYAFAASAPLAFGTMIMQYTTDSEPFPIINSDALTIELRPKSVHIGDESGAAQLAEAFIYKDGAWTAI